MDLLNRFTLNDFIDILPDGVVSILSTNSQLVNNLVYYDKKSLNKISKMLNEKQIDNIQDFLRITQLQGPSESRKLWLNSYQIGNEGAIAIGKGLHTNISLQKLGLSNNQIGYEGVIAIGKWLETNTSLQVLYLGNNQIGDEVKQDLKDIGKRLSKMIYI